MDSPVRTGAEGQYALVGRIRSQGWELGSVLDFLVPIALCSLVFVVARRTYRLTD